MKSKIYFRIVLLVQGNLTDSFLYNVVAKHIYVYNHCGSLSIIFDKKKSYCKVSLLIRKGEKIIFSPNFFLSVFFRRFGNFSWTFILTMRALSLTEKWAGKVLCPKNLKKMSRITHIWTFVTFFKIFWRLPFCRPFFGQK